MKTSEQIQDIAKALSLAQKDIRPASKDASNPHYKSKFSTMAAVWEVIRNPTTSNGLAVLQEIASQDKASVSVITRILHTSGQWIEFDPLFIPVGKQDAQGIGSAASYAKRYALCAALGIVSSDDDSEDDGEAAINRNKSESKTYTDTIIAQKISIAQIKIIQKIEEQLDDVRLAKIYNWMKSVFNIEKIEDVLNYQFTKVLLAYENALRDLEQKKKEQANENN